MDSVSKALIAAACTTIAARAIDSLFDGTREVAKYMRDLKHIRITFDRKDVPNLFIAMKYWIAHKTTDVMVGEMTAWAPLFPNETCIPTNEDAQN